MGGVAVRRAHKAALQIQNSDIALCQQMGNIQEGLRIVIGSAAGSHDGIRHIHVACRHQVDHGSALRRFLTGGGGAHPFFRFLFFVNTQGKEQTHYKNHCQHRYQDHDHCLFSAFFCPVRLALQLALHTPVIQFVHIRHILFRRHRAPPFQKLAIVTAIIYDFPSFHKYL